MTVTKLLTLREEDLPGDTTFKMKFNSDTGTIYMEFAGQPASFNFTISGYDMIGAFSKAAQKAEALYEKAFMKPKPPKKVVAESNSQNRKVTNRPNTGKIRKVVTDRSTWAKKDTIQVSDKTAERLVKLNDKPNKEHKETLATFDKAIKRTAAGWKRANPKG